MAAQDDRERGGEHGLPNSRIDTDLQSLRDQSSSSHLLSRSLPDLAIHPTSAAAAPYETHVSGDVDTHASSNSNPTPSTPNTTNRHSIRHRRRVQWAISPSSASTVPPQPRNQPENFIPRLSSLDELGIDPTGFATLQAALQRHNSNPHHAPASPPDTPDASTPSHSYPQSRASQSTSSSPPASPSPYTRTPAEADTATGPASALLHDNDPALAHIPPGETQGLPAPIHRAPTFQREANLLVRAHSRKVFGFGWRSRRSPSAKTDGGKGEQEKTKTNLASGGVPAHGRRAQNLNRDVSNFGRDSKERIDLERRGASDARLDMRFRSGPHYGHGDTDGSLSGSTTAASSIHAGTGGILSSLLALYGQQHLHSASQSEREDDWDRRDERKYRPGPGSTDAGQGHDHKRKDSQEEKRDSLKEGGSPSKHRGMNPVKPALRLVSDSLAPRPAAARNSGGVFGGLIASTGNIAGAATPAASTIAPTVERPGYHVSRYSWDTGRIMQKRDNETLKQHKRSRFGSQPSLLGVSESATPITDNNASASVRDGPERKPTSQSSNAAGANAAVGTVSEPPSPNHPHPLVSRSQQINGSPAALDSHGDNVATAKRASWADSFLPHGFHAPTPLFSAPRIPSPADSETSVEWHEKETIRHRRDAKRHKEKRRREEIYITMHVAELLQRQEFILKLTRALMMFGAPSHRLEAQIQATAKVLDIQLSCMYIPNVMLFSFDDVATHTSETKILKQTANLDLGKLHDVYMLYWQVIYDWIGVNEASADLDILMRKRPIYKGWVTVLIGGLCSAFITPVSFSGSFIDACIAFPLGCLLVMIQNFARRNELYTNVFEITVATTISFLAAALASTHRFCYAAVASGGVVLVLPGYIVLTGSLELASRSIISGAVRIGYSVIYALYLGFGLAIGGEMYHQISGQTIFNGNDYTCASTHSRTGPWYQRTPSLWWAFLCVPMYSLVLSLRNQAPIRRKELPVSILIACAGWAANHFAAKKFVNRSDITSAIGSFAVGLAGNIYGRFAYGNAFVVMITGVLFQVPSGLANGGLLAFSNESLVGSSTTYSQGFSVAEQLVSVAIGLTVGLFVSTVVVYPFRSNRRGAGLFSL